MSLQTRSMERTSAERVAMPQLKIYIEDIDSLIGSALVEELRNDNENDINPHIIVGSGTHLPRGATRLVNIEDVSQVAQVIMESDIVIFQHSVSQAEFALKLLKHAQSTVQKTFILISSPMTWASTPMKADDSASNRQSVLEQHSPQGDNEFAHLRKYARFIENDLPLRRIWGLEQIKQLEQLILANEKPNLHAYIITPGIVYGRGEDALFSLFRQAWMTPEIELPIQGDGSNVVPMIHVADLAALVGKVITLTPNEKYIFAVDHDTITQKKLVTTIANSVGSGAVKQIPNNGGLLTLNVWMRPTQIFDTDDQFIDAKKNPIMNWHCKEGFTKHILKVRNEFKVYRGLDTVKLIVYGGTASGKSELSHTLAQAYKIPHISIKELLNEMIAKQSELGELVRNTLQSVKDKLVEEALVIFEADKKKKKVPKGQPEPVFDPSSIIPRLPDDVLIQMYKWRLEQNDAQNLGYILDGFPKTPEQAQLLFYNETQPIANLIPKGVIHIDLTDEQIKERSKTLDQGRYNEESVTRRLLNYRKNQEALLGIFKTFEVKTVNDQVHTDITVVKEFISRNGEIQVLEDDIVDEKSYIELVPEQPNVSQSAIVSQSQIPAPTQSKKKDPLNKSINDSRLSKTDKKLTEEQRQEQIRLQEKELLDTRSQPLRQFLADNVVPYLTEGLIELCDKQPEFPLLYLADFLEAKGNELQAPYQ